MPKLNKICILTTLIITPYSHAAEAPDAGRIWQDLQIPASQPKAKSDLKLTPAQPANAPSGGAQITIKQIQLHGHTLFSQQQLQQALGNVLEQSYDLAGLQALSNRITLFYQQQGYPFARAYLPAQTPDDGVIHINIVEAKYGEIKVQGDERAQRFLATLQTGQMIQSAALERSALLLNDLPGVKAQPVLQPGQQVGTSDLQVDVAAQQRIAGNLSLDNYGNRYTGRHRVALNLHAYSPFTLGDDLALTLLHSEQQMWFGGLSYQRPLMGNGLSIRLDYNHSYYELGQDFANLNAFGTSNSRSLTLSYPLLRSQQRNLSLEAAYQKNALQDQQQTTGLNNSKTTTTLPLTLKFDLQDSGISYGEIKWTTGQLELADNLKSSDATSAQSQGRYNVLNVDVSRIQALTERVNLWANFSGQWVDKNVDSSEDFSLGGATGVRAYPSGEGHGDQGQLAQLELRYALANGLNPFMFYDAGYSKTNHSPWTSGDNSRHISGAGLGLRWNMPQLSSTASVAWPNAGGKAQADSQNIQPRVWFNLGYRF